MTTPICPSCKNDLRLIIFNLNEHEGSGYDGNTLVYACAECFVAMSAQINPQLFHEQTTREINSHMKNNLSDGLREIKEMLIEIRGERNLQSSEMRQKLELALNTIQHVYANTC